MNHQHDYDSDQQTLQYPGQVWMNWAGGITCGVQGDEIALK